MNGSASEMFLTTESQWLFLDSWSPWVQGLVICVALIVIALTYFNYRGLVPRWRRALLLSLRIIIVLSMLIIFYEPTMVTEKAARSRNHVVVLLDNSESMALSHGKSTRADVLTAFIEASGVLWERFSNDAELIFHRFSERVSLRIHRR